MCNQTAGLSRYLSKVQQGMQTQLRVLQTEQAKRKSAGKVGGTTEELQYLMNFSTSITQCVAKAMEHLLDFACVSMANVTLIRRDSYLAHVKSRLKQDTLAALRQAPLDLPTLFPDSELKRTSVVLRTRVSHIVSPVAGGTIDNNHPYKRTDNHRYRNLASQHGNNRVASARRKVVNSQTSFCHTRLGG